MVSPSPARSREAPLGLREVASRLGVHYMTVYKYVRSGRLPATKVGDEWRVEVAALDLLAASRTTVTTDHRRTSASGTAGPDAVNDRCDRFRTRLVAGDEGGAWSLVESLLARGASPTEVLLDLVVPALREIGEEWAAGRLTIAEEHRASAVATRVVSRLGPGLTGPGRRRGTVVVGSPAGDHHALPTAIVGDLVRGSRFDVIDLGADTPAESFVDAARAADRLVAVTVTVTAPEALTAVPAVVTAVRRQLPGTAVLVGGGAVTDEVAARTLGSDGWAATPDGLVALYDSLARDRLG